MGNEEDEGMRKKVKRIQSLCHSADIIKISVNIWAKLIFSKYQSKETVILVPNTSMVLYENIDQVMTDTNLYRPKFNTLGNSAKVKPHMSKGEIKIRKNKKR